MRYKNNINLTCLFNLIIIFFTITTSTFLFVKKAHSINDACAPENIYIPDLIDVETNICKAFDKKGIELENRCACTPNLDLRKTFYQQLLCLETKKELIGCENLNNGTDICRRYNDDDYTRIEFTPQTIDVPEPGGTVTINAKLLGLGCESCSSPGKICDNPNQEVELEGELVWTSDDPEIASVDANGIVTLKEYGTATIYVQYKNKISTLQNIPVTIGSQKMVDIAFVISAGMEHFCNFYNDGCVHEYNRLPSYAGDFYEKAKEIYPDNSFGVFSYSVHPSRCIGNTWWCGIPSGPCYASASHVSSDTYLDVEDATNLREEYYAYGETSNASGMIMKVDEENNKIYISDVSGTFQTNETIKERTSRYFPDDPKYDTGNTTTNKGQTTTEGATIFKDKLVDAFNDIKVTCADTSYYYDGGDGYYGTSMYSGLLEAINEFPWREDAKKAIILIGGRPPGLFSYPFRYRDYEPNDNICHGEEICMGNIINRSQVINEALDKEISIFAINTYARKNFCGLFSYSDVNASITELETLSTSTGGNYYPSNIVIPNCYATDFDNVKQAMQDIEEKYWPWQGGGSN